METINFKLTKPIKFDSAEGTPNNESFDLVLKAPSYNERKFARKLKQKLTEAMMYASRQAQADNKPVDETEPKDDEVMDGKSILFMLHSVPENVLDWSEFADWFTSNCASVVSVDEGVGLKSALVSQMDIDTVDEMIGAYLANFTWISLMKDSGSH